MDEKGMQRGGKGQIKHNKYLVPRGQRTNYKLHSSDLQLITIIECVCADGSAIQPTFIFGGKDFNSDMFEGIHPDVCVAHSPSGWTQNTICVEWFKRSFIPQTNARRVSEAPILLILDGHRSHVTIEMINLAIENNIHIFLFPPHTTHRLQPLDVGVFNALQSAWHIHMNRFYRISRGEKMDAGEFIREYLALRNRLFTESLIRSAWDASGITSGHFRADFFPDSDFAPSHTTSILAHVPSSYPTKHPLFPENASRRYAPNPSEPSEPQTLRHIEERLEAVSPSDASLSSESELSSDSESEPDSSPGETSFESLHPQYGTPKCKHIFY
ncbi:hypothetical protein NUW54_g14012 [Trametes sanguinea]|uniref:Uncharacterized protein n=1 Tax=Trametes sanguinea TaxID=158606 RepID=A0ACC1MFG0_9APHY|nr:hypothetical protein NUW54_g14012 [Trametes sanguinea]